MKSDKEFLDGIYAKAELKKQQNPPFLKFRRIVVAPMVMAAAMIFIVWNMEKNPVNLKLSESLGNSASQINMEQSKGRSIVMEYYIEGTVIEVLEPYMGYGRLRVQLNTELSTLQNEKTLVIAYPEKTSMYQKGDYVTATLTQQQLGTQEYYVIAD